MSLNINIKGKTFFIEEGKFDLFWKDIASGNWEPQSFRIIDDFIKPGDTMMDIGCWGGPLTLYAAARGAKVYALDPDPVIFNHLQENIRLNKNSGLQIFPFNTGVSPKGGEKKLYARKEYGLSSSSTLARARDSMFAHTCETLSIEEFCRKEKTGKIDFIKMDVEGAEFDVLNSLNGDFLKSIGLPTLYISFHYNYLREHQHELRFKNFSPITYRLENLFKRDIFQRQNLEVVLSCFSILEPYTFLYTDQGEQLELEFLRKNPWTIREHNIVASVHPWRAPIS